jgi:glycerol-3-phosphate dehydrogenase
VLDRSFLPGDSAIMVPHTDDGRVLFAIPWHNCVVLGTTDTPVDQATPEPRAFEEEIEYLLVHAARYLTQDPTPSDVLSIFAGLRPLVRASNTEDTASLSRDHTLQVSKSGLVTITGGKWTTYRRMAEDTVDMGIQVGLLDERACTTRDLDIHGRHDQPGRFGPLELYGSDAPHVQAVIDETPDGSDLLHPDLPYQKGEVVWAARNEMARTVEDVLARRTRALLLNARASIEAAPIVGELLAATLNKDSDWIKQQVEAYRILASGYILT